MKVFFLYLLIVTNSQVNVIKVPFAYTLRPITCEEAFYKGEVVGAHYCKDIFGNWYWGYEEQLNYDLGH